MPVLHAGLRPVFALLVIAHGLAHAVLPWRGWFSPGMFEHNFMPLVLYCVALFGFTTAGIGLLGVKPFTGAVRPFLVVASAYSLVALYSFGAMDLWVGGAADVVLLLTGLTAAYRFLPAPGSHPGWPHRLAVGTAAIFLVAVGYGLVLWPLQRPWH
jgi:hypothetical protein